MQRQEYKNGLEKKREPKKPKDGLLKTSAICCATHARGTEIEIEAEIQYHKTEIFKIWEQLKEQINFKPFAGFSLEKTTELTEILKEHFECIDEYAKTTEIIKNQFGI